MRHGPRAVVLHGWDWAPDGRRVVVAASREWPPRPMLYTISLDGTNRKALRRGWWPEWSRDGRHIVFSSRFEPAPPPDFVRRGEIAVVRSDGRGFRRLTDSSHDSSPSFSPDGARIVYVRNADSPVEEWRIMDVTGDGDVLVATHPSGSGLGACPPQWTPDGTRLVAVRTESGPVTDTVIPTLVTVSLTGQDERVAFRFPHGFSYPSGICDFSWRPR